MPASQEAPKIAKAVLQGVIETVVGTDPGSGYIGLPVFDVGPLVTPSVETIELNPALDSLSRGGVVTGAGTNLFGFKVYAYADSTVALGATPWMAVPLQCCGFLGGSWGGAAAPTAPTSVVAGAATGLNGGYGYKITTFVVATGVESEASTEVALAMDVVNQDITVAFANPGVGSRTFIYRSKANEDVTGPWQFCASKDGDAGGAQTYTDANPDAELDTGRVPPTGTDAGFQYLPVSEDFKSGTFHGYLDSHKRAGTGSRGSFREVGVAGRSIEINFEIQTRYVAATLKTDNIDGPAYPDQPPKFQAAGDFLRPRSGAFTVAANGTPNALGVNLMPWCLKRFEFSPGTQVTPRHCASASEGIREQSIHQKYQSEVTLVFEVPKGAATADDAFDPVADMKAGVIFNASLTYGTGTLGTIRQTWPALQLVESPVFVDEDSGIRCYSARFGCLDMATSKDCWARILQT